MDRRAWFVVPALALVAIIFLYPTGWLLLRSITEPSWGLQNYAAVVKQPIYLRVLWNTFVISASVTAICLAIGYPVAYTMVHSSERVRRLLVFVILVPFWTSLLVRTFAWMVLLQQKGLVNDFLMTVGVITAPLALIYNRVGVLIGMVQVQLPFVILPLYSVLLRIDPSYSLAAATLGAPPMRNFLRVYFPLSLPGVFTGCALVFIISLGYFITPALLGGPRDVMIAQLILSEIEDFGNWGLAGSLSAVLLLSAALTVWIGYRFSAARVRWAQ
ncbi:MAG TPA: ABC transporter permease [Stellaceae bacterium]|nr:ABC transporter permease [Stellaceae bacterium]